MNILTKEEIEYWIGSNSTKKAVARAIEAAVLKKLAEQDVDPVAECGSMTGTLLAEIELLRTQLAAANAELVRKQERDSQYSNVCCKLSATENEVVQLRQQLAEKDAEIDRLSRSNKPYSNLTKAQESQLTALRNRLYELKCADKTLDSERVANAILTEQLAASQAREQQLREALEGAHKALEAISDEMTVGDRYTNAGQYLTDSLMPSREALAIPSDTTALEAMIAKAGEVMRERCEVAWKDYVRGENIDDAINAIPSVTLEDLK